MPLRDVQSGTSIILELPPHLPTPNRGGMGGGGGRIQGSLRNPPKFVGSSFLFLGNVSSKVEEGKRETCKTEGAKRADSGEVEGYKRETQSDDYRVEGEG